MASGHRIDVTLDAHHSEKLRRLAERMNVPEGTLARSLLVTALDEAVAGSPKVTDVLDGIDGAFERARRGVEHARTDRTVPLEDL